MGLGLRVLPYLGGELLDEGEHALLERRGLEGLLGLGNRGGRRNQRDLRNRVAKDLVGVDDVVRNDLTRLRRLDGLGLEQGRRALALVLGIVVE